MSRLVSLFAVSLILLGCPYNTSKNIFTGEEFLKINKNLIDEWMMFDREKGSTVVKISPNGKYSCKLLVQEFSLKNRRTSSTQYTMQIAEINDIKIAVIESPEGRFHYAKYNLFSKNVVSLFPLSSEFLTSHVSEDKADSEKQIRKMIVKYLHDDELYESKVEFARRGSHEYDKVMHFKKNSGF